MPRLAGSLGDMRDWDWLDVIADRLWPLMFVWAAISAIVIQFLLPPLFPAWFMAGTGMIWGTDSPQNDELSRLLASRIVTEGWSVWSIAPPPDRNIPVGVASALYTIFWPRAWVLIPVNAALCATASVALFHIVAKLTGERRMAVLGMLPFALFPSNLTWSMQLLKDGFSICGVIVLMLGWVLACHGTRAGPRSLLMAAALLVVGVIVSASRGVNAQATAAALALGTLLLTAASIVAVVRRRDAPQALANAAGAWFALAIVMPFTGAGRNIAPDTLPFPRSASVSEETWSRNREQAGSPPQRLTSFWIASDVLPARIDAALHAIALSRAGFLIIYPDAASNIDLDRRPDSAGAVMGYLPRAAQIGFLAPFPRHWIERGSRQSHTIGRRVAAVEMLAVYGALVALPLAAWRFRGNLLLWSMMAACASVIVLLGFVVANVGALHRMRYPYLAIFCSLALSAGLTTAADWSSSRRAELITPGDRVGSAA